MKKILILAALLCSLTILAPSALAYCVYNQSNYPVIWVQDTAGHVIFKGMGPHAVSRGDRVCCAGNSLSCKDARIEADVDPNFSNANENNFLKSAVNCHVSSHGALSINGGGTNNMYCTGG